nr:biogenesis of lysosome-related organelles complex 1 subunit 5-like isoform X2 [Leptinotarsa decemlineata]
MSHVVKDIGKIWDRLFDHRGFLRGEISFIVHEFQQKRDDKEVDKLFSVLEKITDIKDTKVDRLKQLNKEVDKINYDLDQALVECSRFSELEERFIQDTTIAEAGLKRKEVWRKYLNDIAFKYSEVDSYFGAKEEELMKSFEDIEKKLQI